MKKNLLLTASLLVSGFLSAQQTETAVTVNMQPGYANQVYYKFATNVQTPVAANSWDIAFQKAQGRNSGGIRVNDGKVTAIYEASNNIAQWGTIDVTAQTGWTQLYNSETVWAEGAFDNGSAEYGWGIYNGNGDHHVNGSVIFVLKYSATSFKKIIFEDLDTAGQTIRFKYATWNGTAWSADQTATADYTQNPDTSFIYFSLDTNAPITVAPADTAWDMVFTKYYGLTAGQMYPLTGALHNPAVKVAEIDEAGMTENTPALPAETEYSTEINTIGSDWKTFSGTYVIDANKTYYVKDAANAIYRMYFTSFAGTTAGTLSFNYKNVTPVAGLEDVNSNISFSVYPNPSVDGNVTLVYDLKNSTAEKNTVTVYSLTGAKVYETQITNNSGFYTKDINLSSLTGGVYILKLQSGQYTQTKKLVLN